MNPERAIAYRKQVGVLLESVLAGEITARTGINCWPTQANTDPSVRCAYTMLWYFEADADRHRAEVFYADLQLKALQHAATYLKKGDALPATLLRDYVHLPTPPEYDGRRVWQEPLQWLYGQWRLFRSVLMSYRGR